MEGAGAGTGQARTQHVESPTPPLRFASADA